MDEVTVATTTKNYRLVLKRTEPLDHANGEHNRFGEEHLLADWNGDVRSVPWLMSWTKRGDFVRFSTRPGRGLSIVGVSIGDEYTSSWNIVAETSGDMDGASDPYFTLKQTEIAEVFVAWAGPSLPRTARLKHPQARWIDLAPGERPTARQEAEWFAQEFLDPH